MTQAQSVEDHKPLWDKLDKLDSEQREITAWRQTTEYRIGQMETRFDMSIKDNARAFGELAHALKEVSKEVSEIHAEQMRQMGRMDTMNAKESGLSEYKRWFWPVLISTLGFLYTVGFFSGGGV